ncbi:hypothetical protein [Mesorhizobium sp. B1-1-7]|uniref:hypothetical protein n=1 Tax=Mesorhizobium sp. B1-1-7 TaxID=2589977 RepID=UPI001171DE6F|nr:hypothetical protein [Mesorhizobium sp. B1-1-7]TPN49349.1 hypothetical protein FJ978_19320 [Mesorhizobium sp. B1-1-7]
MPNTRVQAAGEAVSSMIDRRAILRGALVTAALPLAMPAKAEPPLSRQDRIKACILQLDALLSEETGLPWSIWMASTQCALVNGERQVRYLGFDSRLEGFYDLTGIVGSPQRYGTTEGKQL